MGAVASSGSASAQPRRDAGAAAAAPAPQSAPSWRAIHFVDVVDPFGARTELTADLVNLGPQGMRVSLVADGTAQDVLHDAVVRMHLPDGTVVAAARDPLAGVQIYGGPGPRPTDHWTGGALFPWQRNALDEAWIEVDLGARGRYWLEVPYGFVRDPAASLPTARDPRIRAQLARAMSRLTDRDHLVPFRHVVYQVGAIQNGWQLSVLLSNPFDAHAELQLYRDDSRVGRSSFLWDLDTPTTSAEMLEHSGGTLSSLVMMRRLDEAGMQRSDHFHFNRGGPCTRGWGSFRATVDGRAVTFRIPSSLYGYTHGTADPYHARRVVVGANAVLGPDLF